MKKKPAHRPSFLIPAIATAGALLLLALVALFLALSPFSSRHEAVRISIDRDDNADSVYHKLSLATQPRQMLGLKLIAAATHYPQHIRTGSYLVGPRLSSLELLRKLRNHNQDPLRITVPCVRTKANLADRLGSTLMIEPGELLSALNDSATCSAYNLDTLNIISLFLPNTYEVYWDISIVQLLERMQRESNRFWSTQRLAKADSIGLSPQQVITLASIIDEETANNAEKPMIAGMYLNRLRIAMPLQADPTVKFALGDFSLRRIYHHHLTVDSPYNTYKSKGLPPGPIRIPTLAAIDAVLNPVSHNYLYMCANPNFTGTHIFASTYDQHLRNARLYAEALNKRNIK